MFCTIHRINGDNFPISIYNGDSVCVLWSWNINYVNYLEAFHVWTSYKYRIVCQMCCQGVEWGRQMGWFDRSWRLLSSKLPLTVVMLYLLSHRMCVWAPPLSTRRVFVLQNSTTSLLSFLDRQSILHTLTRHLPGKRTLIAIMDSSRKPVTWLSKGPLPSQRRHCWERLQKQVFSWNTTFVCCDQ